MNILNRAGCILIKVEFKFMIIKSMSFYYYFMWVLSLIGRTPDCQLGKYQFESGRTRLKNNKLFIFSLIKKNKLATAQR